VNVHDFENKKLGKVVPYGVYDVTANAGFVNVGITSDAAEFAVQSIRCGLDRMGRARYAGARADDHGGLWRFEWRGCGSGRWSCKSSPTKPAS
jgi:hypothetical protein